MFKITFIGATGTVTGSKYLCTYENKKFLIDCGLFQGLKELRLRNWAPLPFKPSELDFVLLTHAHLDHSGYIPLLIKNGFKGKIYCTHATYDLCKILLLDSAMLQEEEADFANRHKYSKHDPALPLYTRKDAEHSFKHFNPIDFNEPLKLQSGLSAEFSPAGHILGAASISLRWEGKHLLMSGDIGRLQDIIMKPPTFFTQADYIVTESTYGNRLHEVKNAQTELADVINRTVARGGVIIMPAFAVGRAQTLLFLLHELKKNNMIPNVPIYLDSPMASDVTELFCQYQDQHYLSKEECHWMNHVADLINTPDLSKALDINHSPKVIVSASGMATGGRVVHHLKTYITDHRNTILFTGYQAAGTRGAAIVSGAKQVKIFGEEFPVRAEIVSHDHLSAHADYAEILSWLGHLQEAPKKVFLTHGEPDPAQAMAQKIREKFGWTSEVPTYLQSFNLS